MLSVGSDTSSPPKIKLDYDYWLSVMLIEAYQKQFADKNWKFTAKRLHDKSLNNELLKLLPQFNS